MLPLANPIPGVPRSAAHPLYFYLSSSTSQLLTTHSPLLLSESLDIALNTTDRLINYTDEERSSSQLLKTHIPLLLSETLEIVLNTTDRLITHSFRYRASVFLKTLPPGSAPPPVSSAKVPRSPSC
ncbi:UNVERIFIED_CONTAM: hypothetical protein RMT77_001982 [Armadillidium vulgare]